MHANLGFSMDYSDNLGAPYYVGDSVYPQNRKVTHCPSSIYGDMSWFGGASYGNAYGSPRSDYEDYNCEVELKRDGGAVNILQMTKMDAVPSATTFALLADSAYTENGYLDSPNRPCGTECPLFSRRDTGDNVPSFAIAARHNGIGNIAFVDGHVGDTNDRAGLWKQSKIAAISDGAGYLYGEVFKEGD